MVVRSGLVVMVSRGESPRVVERPILRVVFVCDDGTGAVVTGSQVGVCDRYREEMD